MTVHTPGIWCRVRLFELCELVHTEALLINGNVNVMPAIIYTHTHQRDKGGMTHSSCGVNFQAEAKSAHVSK